MKAIHWINYTFLSDEEEIHVSDKAWFYGGYALFIAIPLMTLGTVLLN